MKSEPTKEINVFYRDKQKRVTGCLGWAIILSLLMSFFFGILANIRVGASLFANFDIGGYFVWFIIFIIPTSLVSTLIGGYIRKRPKWQFSTIIIFPLVSAIYFYFLYFSVNFGKAISDTPSKETFWDPPIIGTSAICFSLILGVTAAYGFWHAGRKKS